MQYKNLRLRKLFDASSGRSILLPIDHGTTIGPIGNLKEIPSIVRLAQEEKLQGIVAHKGTIAWATKHLQQGEATEFILHLSASTNMGPDSSFKQIVSSIQHALRIGATGISVHINLGVTEEPKMLKDLGIVCDEAYAWGLPVLVMVNICKDNDAMLDPPLKNIAHAIRIAGELGADLVKVQTPVLTERHSDLFQVFDIPVLIAGGALTTNRLNWFKSIELAISAGCMGLCIGRNVFEDKSPNAMCRSLRALVHQEVTAEEAESLYLTGAKDSRPSELVLNGI
jgi:class I fructose-bisphosphate aldolase